MWSLFSTSLQPIFKINLFLTRAIITRWVSILKASWSCLFILFFWARVDIDSTTKRLRYFMLLSNYPDLIQLVVGLFELRISMFKLLVSFFKSAFQESQLFPQSIAFFFHSCSVLWFDLVFLDSFILVMYFRFTFHKLMLERL